MYTICMIRDCITCARCSARRLRRYSRRDRSNPTPWSARAICKGFAPVPEFSDRARHHSETRDYDSSTVSSPSDWISMATYRMGLSTIRNQCIADCCAIIDERLSVELEPPTDTGLV